jgi:hypothetical protein
VGDTSEVLEPPEHPFDGVPVSVTIGRETVLPDPIGFRRDAENAAASFNPPPQAIAVVSFVGMDQDVGRQVTKELLARPAIRRLATSQYERERSAATVGQGMDLRRPSAA